MPQFRVLITDYAWPNLDLERAGLAEADAELVVATKTDAASLAELAKTCDAIMTNWAKVPAEVIAAVPNCRIVSRLGIGLDNIDVAYCNQQKIPVTNVPDYCLIEVAEHALALLLSLARKVAYYHHETMQGRYQLQAGPKLRRIEGQTLGIVGLGNIGRKLASKAQALGMKVIASSRTRSGHEGGIEFVPLETLIQQSDYISLHTPLSPENRHSWNAQRFAMMKPTAYLINTARGGLIDHAALFAALEKGHLAGAALDVQDPEPPDLTQAPYNDPRVIITPHAAFVSEESLANLRTRVAKQVATRLLGGIPENVVNGVL
jgi:D-3-phosphoglycerate dehydrogenase